MFGNYTIKNGDSLTKVAKRHGTTVAELAKLNNIEDPDKIFIGDNLIVPKRPSMDETNALVKAALGEFMPPQQTMSPMEDPRGMPHPGMFDPQRQALQQSSPEALLGMPGMLKAGGMAAMGGLGALAKVAPRMAQAGRMPPPAGYSNVVPMGNSAGFNSSMAQGILNSKGGLGYPASNVMRQMRTPTNGGPDYQLAQMLTNKNYPLKPGR